MAVVKPTRGDADGLLLGLGEALSRIGIEDIHSPNSVLGVDKMPVLIGAGTDGASVNVGAHGGMKGKLQSDLPWLFWSWCFAHWHARMLLLAPCFWISMKCFLGYIIFIKIPPKNLRNLPVLSVI